MDILELKKLSCKYFKQCDSRKKKKSVKNGGVVEVPDPAPYTIEGLSLALGVTSQTFRNWEKQDDEVGEYCRLLRERVCENRVVGGLDGTQNSAIVKLTLVNQHGYQERLDIETSVSEDTKSLIALLEGKANKLSPAGSEGKQDISNE